MIVIGALLASCAATFAVLGAQPRSAVLRRLALLAPRSSAASRVRALVSAGALERSGFGWSPSQLLAAKIVCALIGCAVAAGISLLTGLAPGAVAAAAYGGFVLPTVRVERAARIRAAEAEASLVTLVEWVEALVATGRPIETAIVDVGSRGVGAPLADEALAAACRSYSLGAPLFAALAREADRAGVSDLARLAHDLERARDLGRGASTVLREERDRLRAAARARSLDAASRVEGRLMLILVLCYMPALMLLVVVPLFLALLNGLQG